MASVWGELKRRNVVRVAVAYAIVGWLLIEISSTVLPTFQAPLWVLQTITFVIILGFPLALVLSWAFDLTPGGLERTRSVSSGAANKGTSRRLDLDYVLIGVLVLAVGYLLVNDYLPQGSDPDVANETPAGIEIAPESSAPVVVEEQSDVLPNSVAVLLCDNLSPDPDDAYFAAGIHDEILNQLFKLGSLTPISRNAVLQYGSNPPPIPQVAEELRVESVMECSVRYAGDSVLVTAQLIDPATNLHLWSDTYEGDLSDVSTLFAIQADIAMIKDMPSFEEKTRLLFWIVSVMRAREHEWLQYKSGNLDETTWLSYRGVINFALGTERARRLWGTCAPFFNSEFVEMVEELIGESPLLDFWDQIDAVA